MSKKTIKPTYIEKGKNPPPIKPGSDAGRTGYNPPPVGERPRKPIITPAPPPKKKE